MKDSPVMQAIRNKMKNLGLNTKNFQDPRDQNIFKQKYAKYSMQIERKMSRFSAD